MIHLEADDIKLQRELKRKNAFENQEAKLHNLFGLQLQLNLNPKIYRIKINLYFNFLTKQNISKNTKSYIQNFIIRYFKYAQKIPE